MGDIVGAVGLFDSEGAEVDGPGLIVGLVGELEIDGDAVG